jgi:hypothetical protein
MGKRKSTAEDKAGEMDVDGDSSDDVSHLIKKLQQIYRRISKRTQTNKSSRTHP